MKRRRFLQLLGLAPAVAYFRVPAPSEDLGTFQWSELTEEGMAYVLRLKQEMTRAARRSLFGGSWSKERSRSMRLLSGTGYSTPPGSA